MSLLMRYTAGMLGAILLLPGMIGCNPCQDDGQVVICGEFGELAYVVDAFELSWPAVATEDSLLVSSSFELMQISGSGNMTSVASFDGGASAPSMASDGTVYVVTNGATTQSYAPGHRSAPTWSAPVPGTTSTTPPAVDDGEVHVSTTTGDPEDRTLVTVDEETGEVTQTREGASPAAVAEDGSLRYLEEPYDCGARFRAIVAEEKNGDIRWRYTDDSGISDFAPGPDGEVYIVNGNRTLLRLSDQGAEEWDFMPDCEECNVASAPTVTKEAVYFPVWEGFSPNPGCDDPEPEFNDSIDPLYALTRDGDLMWTYDGFETMGTGNGVANTLGGPLMLSTSQRVRHHPAGRPVVAEDGTLFVATDGAIAALTSDGRELGWAMFNQFVGETKSGDGGLLFASSWVNPTFSAAPVLGPDGRLYIWDGMSVRAFNTDKPSANIPWNAPFGSNRNSGRVGQ